MKKGKTNFARAIDYLRSNGFVRNQKELADRIGSTPTTVSRNKHGLVSRPDEETIVRFNAVFGHIINIAYLRGESDIMLVSGLSPQDNINTGVNSETAPAVLSGRNDTPDTSSLINAALAAKDETIMSLRRELKAKDATISILHDQLIDRTSLMRSTQQHANDIASKYEALLREHHTLLHRISVNIEHFQDSHLSIAAEPASPYSSKG